MIPFVVVEGPEAAFEDAVREVVAAGWRADPGFAGTRGHGAAVVRIGTVDSAEAARAALLAALAGQAVVARATASRDVIDRLVDDLRRLGPVDHRTGQDAPAPTIDGGTRAILGLLAEGHTLGEAATILGLSRRTADRRLAEGRRALGTTRTTEAILRARRLGWLVRGRPAPD